MFNKQLYRMTEDKEVVYPCDYVYEIIYRYINPEVSLPEPEYRKAGNIPRRQPVWASERNCRNQCRKIIARIRKTYRDELLTYFTPRILP